MPCRLRTTVAFQSDIESYSQQKNLPTKKMYIFLALGRLPETGFPTLLQLIARYQYQYFSLRLNHCYGLASIVYQETPWIDLARPCIDRRSLYRPIVLPSSPVFSKDRRNLRGGCDSHPDVGRLLIHFFQTGIIKEIVSRLPSSLRYPICVTSPEGRLLRISIWTTIERCLLALSSRLCLG